MYLLLDGKLDVKGPEESNNDEDDDDNGGGDRDEVRGDSALVLVKLRIPEIWDPHAHYKLRVGTGGTSKGSRP